GEVVAGRFRGLCGGAFRMCLFGWYAVHVGSFGGGVFPHPCRVAYPLRARSFHPCSLRDTLTEYESF
ncbi:hypothetical protein K0G13_18660, partial [Phocaeicola vulgatus]